MSFIIFETHLGVLSAEPVKNKAGREKEGFPGGSESKESSCNLGDLRSIPGWGRSAGGEHGNQFQYSCLENPHGQKSLADYSPWGRRESDMTEQLSTEQSKGI